MQNKRDAAWNEFTATGRVDSYLRYRAIADEEDGREEETPWVSSKQRESSPVKSSTEIPRGF